MTSSELRRIRRGRLGLTQALLAQRLGVTTTTVARWETGQRAISELAGRFVRLLAEVEGRHARKSRK